MSALGYPVFRLRVTVFIIAALYAGVGGILAAWSSGIVTPTAMQMSRTIWILLIVILGGAQYFWGPVLGTVVAVWFDVLISQLTSRYNSVIGLVFLAVILVAPNGILGVLERLGVGRQSPVASPSGTEAACGRAAPSSSRVSQTPCAQGKAEEEET